MFLMRFKIKIDIVFWLFLIYSLLSGANILAGTNLFMLLCVPIILLLITKKYDINIYKIGRINSVLLLTFILICFYSFSLCFFDHRINSQGFFLGLFLDILPVLGICVCARISFEKFVNTILYISIIHVIIALILYPPFGIYRILGEVGYLFIDNMLAGRMCSVSGSLAFGNLMMLACLISFFVKRKFLPIFLIGLIFSLQRSAWFGFAISVIFGLYFLLLEKNLLKLSKMLIGFCIAVIVMYVASLYLNFDLLFVFDRFSGVDGAASERVGQWINGLTVFKENFMGVGIGQVGHIAAMHTNSTSYLICADGDYFRIMAEYGLLGCFILLMIFSQVVVSFFYCLKKNKYMQLQLALVIAILIQMLGSNITEFFFNNFIVWCILGYFFQSMSRSIKYN